MPHALYRCRSCGNSYVLRVIRVLETITLGTMFAPGGAPHGPKRDCRNKVFDLVGDAPDAA